MKKKIIILIIAVLLTGKMYAQVGWEKINLPESININKIYCLDENTLFGWHSIAFPEYIYKTDDGGKNWKVVFDDPIGKGFSAFHISFLNHNIGFCLYANYLLKTNDSGNSWFKFTLLPHTFNYKKIVTIDEENIWLLGPAGFQISTDGGNCFQEVEKYDKAYSAIGCNNGIGYAVDGASNVLTTTDKGQTWNFVSNLFGDEMSSTMEHNLQIFDSNKATFNGFQNLIRTEDGFQSINKYPSPANQGELEEIAFTDHQHGMVMMLKGDERELYYTKDGCNEWSMEFGADYQISHVAGKGRVWYAIGDGILYKTTKPLHISTEKVVSAHIYPNPVIDSFIIESGDKQVTQIEIFDVTGRMLFFQHSPAQNIINIETLAKGIYIAKIDIENSVYQVKILKQ